MISLLEHHLSELTELIPVYTFAAGGGQARKSYPLAEWHCVSVTTHA